MRYDLAIAVFVMFVAAAAYAAEKTTIAILPIAGSSQPEQALAEKVRFALSQKISRDGAYDRKDNTDIDDAISALQIPIRDEIPSAADLAKIAQTLGVERVITGKVDNRKVMLVLYQQDKQISTATGTIPTGKESPKLAYEKLLTDLLNLQFKHITEVECDHSDPVTEKRFAERTNLCPDPGFEIAGKNWDSKSATWGAVMRAERYPPPLISASEADALPEDRVAIVPNIAGDGHYLLMRMSKEIAESNGLACESTWIPVEQGAKYRFTVRYRSAGPRLRLFIKGFAVNGDQYGDKNDPEAVRREYYRFQVLPRESNKGWELIEADFNPGSLKPTDPPIQWIRVDLFIYLHPGDASFDDVVVKKISP